MIMELTNKMAPLTITKNVSFPSFTAVLAVLKQQKTTG